MQKILSQQNPHWLGDQYEVAIERAALSKLLKLLTLEEILVLTGVRRCGKTTMYQCLINHLCRNVEPKTILYLNFDAPHFNAVNNDVTFIYNIIEAAEIVTGEKMQYLILDEIQNVAMWEKFVKSSYDSKVFKKIMITGSNSKLLQSEYTTLLSGRYVEKFIMPLSF